MFSLLLPLIYVSFISLGLPDAMLGAAWPSMSLTVNRSLADLGLVSMISTLGAVISSLLSSRLIDRFGTGKVMVGSVLLTALGLLLYSFSGSYLVVCLLAFPLGMGGGAVDTGLNGFVARNYKASHMSWLHFMWGVGATLGPLIVGTAIKRTGAWPQGYLTAAILQGILLCVLLFSLPLWKKAEKQELSHHGVPKKLSLSETLKIPGLKTAMLAFFCMVGFEYTGSVWAASFLEEQKGFDAASAALLSSIYFLGTTLGRGFSGFIAMRIDSRRMIRFGILLAFFGALLLALPLPRTISLIGYLFLGLGNAPLFPSMTFLTPRRFGTGLSQAVIGMQIAAAYFGSTLMPPLTGLIVRSLSLKVVPFMLLFLIAGAWYFTQRVDKRTADITKA